MSELRTTEQRKQDVLATLGRNGQGWIATANRGGEAHLIAVSTTWHDGEILIATRGPSATARNLNETRSAKLAVGTPDDVILVDLELVETRPANADAADLASIHTAAQGWDPAEEGPDWAYFRLRPKRIQAYLGYAELEGRDVMRGGRWLA